ncbi:MAG: hypothetical protein AAB617_02505 [Patescibacteria group bacterium]
MISILNSPYNLYRWFVNLPWTDLAYLVQGFFILCDIFLIAGLVFVFMKSLELRPRFVFTAEKRRPRIEDKGLMLKWEKILKKAESAPPQSFTLGIIEADNFIDDILKKMGLKGETMGERMEHMESMNLNTLEKLWRAHRLRNDLVHTSGFTLSVSDAKRVMTYYETFLKELGVLE